MCWASRVRSSAILVQTKPCSQPAWDLGRLNRVGGYANPKHLQERTFVAPCFAPWPICRRGIKTNINPNTSLLARTPHKNINTFNDSWLCDACATRCDPRDPCAKATRCDTMRPASCCSELSSASWRTTSSSAIAWRLEFSGPREKVTQSPKRA